MRRLLPVVFPLFLFACRGGGVGEYKVPKDPPASAPSAAAPLSSVRGGLAGSERKDSLAWTDPAGWTRAAADGFRLASYRVKGPDGEADVSVVVLSGEAGGVLANVERWRGQLGLSPLGSAAALASSSRKVPTQAGEAVFADLLGPEENGKRTRMLGAVLPRPGETWFLKMTGPEKTVGAAREAFLALLAGMRPAR